MTTVSVIIPAYNHAAFLRQAIESVLNQTWHDLEIIVVDDGSHDETPQIAAKYESAIHYIRQANQGMAATRNNGIRHSAGDLISFLDDDDVWLPNYLLTVVSYFQADPSLAAIHTGFQLTSDEEGRDFPRQGTQTVSAAELYNRLIENGFFPPSSVSVRRSCLDSVGLFDERLQGCADWELWLRICREHKFIGIPDVLIKYRLHAGGLSSNVQHMTEDRLKAIHKHFGPPEGQVNTWARDKRRAYAFAYRSAAFEYSIQGNSDELWRFIKQAVPIWPEILTRMDTFYELACGDQPRGYRGKAELLDMDRNGAEMLKGLDMLFAQSEPALESMRRPAYGNAYLALAILNDQAGRWAAARRYLFQAIKADPRLLASYPVMRRLVKTCAGKKVVRLSQKVLGNQLSTDPYALTTLPQR
jgi:glycosyltransferase involved in cell wall biosynthesis